MKKILFITCSNLLIAFNCFCQSVESTDYLKKSKKQKTAAWVLLGVGVLSTALGSVQTNPTGYWGGETTHSNNTVLLIVGAAAIGSSIPLFIAASKNKKKAMSVSLKTENMRLMNKNYSIYTKTIPSLSLTFYL